MGGASQRFAQQLDVTAIQEHNSLMDNGFNATAEMTSLFLQSTKLAEDLNINSIIGTYLTFTHKCNLPARNVFDSFKCSIICSLKLADTDRIWQAMDFKLPQDGLVRFDRLVENVYGDFSEWEKILQMLSFEEEETTEYLRSADSDFCNDLPTIKFVLDTLQQVGADSLSITDALKIYLITNVKNVTSFVAIKAFLTSTMPATFNASDSCNIFTACMADSRFTQAQFSDDLAWFMMNVIVSQDFHSKCIFFMETKESMLQWSQKEITKQHVARGRVRLRYRIGGPNQTTGIGTDTPLGDSSSSAAAAGNTSDGGTSTTAAATTNNNNNNAHTTSCTSASQTSQMKQDSLNGWAVRARIPPAISHQSRLLGYVLMSQVTFADPSNALRTHFSNDAELASTILAQRIAKPQASAIIDFLRLLTVHVTPFDELIAFREQCFADFSYTDSKDLSWLNFLQLYVAAYQNEDVWPHVWKSFCTVLSHQVLIAVGNFKKQHVYAVDKVVEICMQGGEESRKAVSDVS
jgi:hypothetical protein